MSGFDFLVGAAFGACVLIIATRKNKNSGPLDATDDHATGARSQMLVLVDHGTGCQYLSGPDGGLTPRLDATGKHICKPTEAQP